MPVDYHKVYPKINGYMAKPLLVNPPMITNPMHLFDGTITLAKLEWMHQIIEIRQHMTPTSSDAGGN